MKKITFLLLLTFGLSQFANSQCTANANGFGNNTSIPFYNVQGSIQVVLNTNNTVTVNLMSNFTTASGPDVRIFLLDRGNLTNAQLKVSSNFLNRPRIEMGIVSASGAASFTKTIPAGMNISDFETVYFYCQAFSQFWDYGSYVPFSTATCAFLETNTFETNKLQLYPNPTTNELNIQLESTVATFNVLVYNSLGSLVIESMSFADSKATLDVSQLNSGVYFVQITNDQNKILRKRFIKN